MTQKRVLLVEVFDFHAFVLLGQIAMLQEQGYAVSLLLNINNPDFDVFQQMTDIELLPFPCTYNIPCILRTVFQISIRKYDFVVFNTLPWAIRQKLAFLLIPHEVRCILHQVGLREHAQGSRLQTISDLLLLRKATRLFYLSDALIKHARRQYPQYQAKIYPYMVSHLTSAEQAPVPVPGDKVYFAILGPIDSRRRNYQLLIDSMAALAASSLAQRISILLMGSISILLRGKTDTRMGEILIATAEKYQLLGTTIQIQSEAYEPLGEYFQKLSQVHYILPLIDDSTKEKYYEVVAPSSMMISQALSIPFVVTQDLKIDSHLEPIRIQYPPDDLLAGLQAAVDIVDNRHYDELRTRYRVISNEQQRLARDNYLG